MMRATNAVGDSNKSAEFALCRQMGHDLRQPLHGLGMLLSVLDQQIHEDQTRQTVAYIHDAVNEMQATVDHYGQLARQSPAAPPTVPAATGLLDHDAVFLGQGFSADLHAAFVRMGARVLDCPKLDALFDVAAGTRPGRIVVALASAVEAPETLAGLILLGQQLSGQSRLVMLVNGKLSSTAQLLAERAGIRVLNWPVGPGALLAACDCEVPGDDGPYDFLDFSDEPGHE